MTTCFSHPPSPTCVSPVPFKLVLASLLTTLLPTTSCLPLPSRQADPLPLPGHLSSPQHGHKDPHRRDPAALTRSPMITHLHTAPAGTSGQRWPPSVHLSWGPGLLFLPVSQYEVPSVQNIGLCPIHSLTDTSKLRLPPESPPTPHPGLTPFLMGAAKPCAWLCLFGDTAY